MLKNELDELIKKIIEMQADEQTIEVKKAHDGTPKRLYDTLSSFSNQDEGGIIVFGLDETQGFKPVGVYDLQDLQKKVTEQCNQMNPKVRAVFTSTIYRGVNICSAEIPSVDLILRPCYYAGHGKIKGSYVRVGDADLPMTDYEIHHFESYKSHVHDDERKIERANLSLLRETDINNFVLQMKMNRPGFSKLSEEQIFELLSITRDKIPTLSSVLNFGIYPQGLLPQLSITAIVVPGESMGDITLDGIRFLDNKRIEGTLSEMLEDAIAFCKRNMKTKTIIHPDNGKREDRMEYPINAIREIILNALIHRDYSIYTEGTPIQICFFSNRLEVHSPGSLYGRMTVKELGKARPDLRNPALATMSEFLLKTENRYSGIPTIYREMKEYGLPEPVFENKRNEFVVTLYNEQNTRSDMDLISFCKVPKTRQEIANFLGIKTIAFVSREYIQPLIESGKLKMTNPDKPRSKNQKYVSVE
ncbi:MAG: ATP-binding protein [Floccifex sp.]